MMEAKVHLSQSVVASLKMRRLTTIVSHKLKPMGLFQLPGSTNSKPRLYVDPFKKDGFKSSIIFIRKSPWSSDGGKIEYSSHIEFGRGETEGKQNFKADTLPELLQKMEAFMLSLD